MGLRRDEVMLARGIRRIKPAALEREEVRVAIEVGGGRARTKVEVDDGAERARHGAERCAYCAVQATRRRPKVHPIGAVDVASEEAALAMAELACDQVHHKHRVAAEHQAADHREGLQRPILDAVGDVEGGERLAGSSLFTFLAQSRLGLTLRGERAWAHGQDGLAAVDGGIVGHTGEHQLEALGAMVVDDLTNPAMQIALGELEVRRDEPSDAERGGDGGVKRADEERLGVPEVRGHTPMRGRGKSAERQCRCYGRGRLRTRRGPCRVQTSADPRTKLGIALRVASVGSDTRKDAAMQLADIVDARPLVQRGVYTVAAVPAGVVREDHQRT
eukprot:1331443-Prymnesium_polylepis.2